MNQVFGYLDIFVLDSRMLLVSGNLFSKPKQHSLEVVLQIQFQFFEKSSGLLASNLLDLFFKFFLVLCLKANN